MRKLAVVLIVPLCLLCFWAVSTSGIRAPETGEVPEKALPRFHKVNGDLYRGGMPEEEGFRYLRDIGIKTVVNLRKNDDERSRVESLKMKYVHIPLSAMGGIDDSSIREFFKIVNDPDSCPVFVHCRRGADRTGTMVAFYRIAFEGWEPERAYREARDIGLSWWYFKLRKQIRNFDPKRFSEFIPSK